MLDIPFYKQDNRYTCGPAVLQMAFAYFGKKLAEGELALRLNVTEDGASHEEMIKLANNEGFFVYADNESTFDEIRYFIGLKKPVIVNFIEPSNDEGHYAVVKEVTDHSIILNDPWNGENFKMTQKDFENRWSSEDAKNKRWIMALSKEEFVLGKQFKPTD